MTVGDHVMLQSTVVTSARRSWPLALLAGCISLALSPHASRAESGAPIRGAVLTSSAAPSVRASLPTAATLSTRAATASSIVQPNSALTPEAAAATIGRWLKPRGRECERRKVKGFRFCAGPRRAPEPFGPAAELAAKLGLGEKKTVSLVLLEAPSAEWIAAATPDPVRAQAQAREAQARMDAGEAVLPWPVDGGKFWRGFGRGRKASKQSLQNKRRPRGRHHDGIDIGAPEGSTIRAVQDGLVIYADNQIRGYGNLLVTVHPDGSVAFYAHCRSIFVFPGQLIQQGQLVAEVGQTGYARGAHLHFELRKDGKLKDPMRLLAKPNDPGHS